VRPGSQRITKWDEEYIYIHIYIYKQSITFKSFIFQENIFLSKRVNTILAVLFQPGKPSSFIKYITYFHLREDLLNILAFLATCQSK
jgi:hypothetical protein